MSQYETINLDLEDEIAIITFNRAEKWNAFSYQLVSEFCLALNELSKNDAIRCLIITGEGKAFSVGGDINEFKEAKDTVKFMNKLANKLHEGIGLIKVLKFPVIAAINGPCFGAALGYVCACDLRYCFEGASFGTAFTGIGLSTDSSTSFFLPRMVGLSLATEMIMLNKVLNSKEAQNNGLISAIFHSKDSFLEDIKEIALKLSKGPTIAFRSVRQLLEKSYHNNLDTHLKMETEKITNCAGTDDFQEGLNAFLEKRKPIFKGK
jgi:2-(1,2-epoxy-1,2-dihydrophenyl)acetyl-CoA isomerase